jgi:hypothetical protein
MRARAGAGDHAPASPARHFGVETRILNCFKQLHWFYVSGVELDQQQTVLTFFVIRYYRFSRLHQRVLGAKQGVFAQWGGKQYEDI